MASYTYLIGWSDLDKWYYGSQYGKKANPKNLWNPYKTSSKRVRAFIRVHGEPDVIKVRKVFEDNDHARLWEHRVLQRMNVSKDDRFLNQTTNVGIKPGFVVDPRRKEAAIASMKLKLTGKKRSAESSYKTKIGLVGKVWWNNGATETKSVNQPPGFNRGRLWKPSDQHKAANVLASTGRPCPTAGRPQSAASNQLRSNALRGKQKHLQGKMWFHNGKTMVAATSCPEGFVRGRLKKPSQELRE